MALDERKIGGVETDGFSIENKDHAESTETTEIPSRPEFGIPTELDGDESTKQVVPLESQSTSELPLEVDSGTAHDMISSEEKSQEARVLESLINHGVPLEDASAEMEQVLGLSADLKE